MGRARRVIPAKLGKKLLQVRLGLGYNMPQMAAALSDDLVVVHKQDIFRFEKGEREPSLIVILRYSKLAKASIECLIDDNF
jgi:DNA-binding XRE family transcriptional regulator